MQIHFQFLVKKYILIIKEIEDFGENIDQPNIARNYINKIRLRKGLPIDEKLIKHADKQKTLSKKKQIFR